MSNKRERMMLKAWANKNLQYIENNFTMCEKCGQLSYWKHFDFSEDFGSDICFDCLDKEILCD